MINKLLCKLGIHKWEYVKMIYMPNLATKIKNNEPFRVVWECQCKCCGAEKIE